MENQSPTTPSKDDTSDSLESTSTVVETTASSSEPAASNKAPSSAPTTSEAKPQNSPSGFKKLFSRINVYLALLIIVVLLAIGGIVLAILHNNKPSPQSSVNSQTLTQAELNQLQGSSATVGNSQQNLTVESDATFNGTVLVKSDLSVAGNLKIGGTLSLPGILISGSSNLGTLQATSLNVIGNVVTQGNMTVQKNLSVAGTGSFSGVLSASQIVTQNLQLENDLVLSKHLTVTGSAPSRSDGSALGNGGTTAVSGTDTAGITTINTGGSPSSGCFLSQTFNEKFSSTPSVLITPANSAAASLQYYVTTSTTGFSICTANAPGGSQTFIFNYFVIG